MTEEEIKLLAKWTAQLWELYKKYLKVDMQQWDFDALIEELGRIRKGTADPRHGSGLRGRHREEEAVMYKDMEARKEYARKWRQRARAENVDGVFGVYKLTDAEKIRLGLKKPAPLRGTIHIVIPEHYGSSRVIWMSRFVTEAQLDGYKAQYPDMQIIG